VIQRHGLRWYGHVLRKDENDSVNYEVGGVRPRGRPKKPRSEVIENKCARKMLWTIENGES